MPGRAAGGAGGGAVPASLLLPPDAGLSADARMASAGLVFQFPERHFLGGTLAQELAAGWPAAPGAAADAARAALTARALHVLRMLGLDRMPLDMPLAALSDGYKR